VTTDAAVGGDGGGTADEQDRWFLNDQREFLLRSIDDAEREYDAGDLAKADFDVLIVRDRTRLAEVDAELAALGPERSEGAIPIAEPEVAPVRRRYSNWRRAGMVVACLFIAAGALILVDHALNPAAPGQPSSGSTPESKTELIAAQLAEAVILNDDGEGVPALQLYQKVLSEDPGDPVALAASGWLEWNYGNAARSGTVMSAGRSAEQKAIRLAPTYYAGHLFLGLIIFNQDHDATGAIGQFTKFLADSPPTVEVTSFAAQVIPAYTQAKMSIPAQLAAALATTTPTSTTTAPSTSTP
jgi:hypothetical protein